MDPFKKKKNHINLLKKTIKKKKQVKFEHVLAYTRVACPTPR